MRAFESLRFRLIAAAAVWLIIALVAGYFAFSAIFAAQVKAGFDDELQVHVQEIERITRFNRQGAAKEHLPFSDPRYTEADSGFYWEVAANGKPVYSSASLQGRPFGPLPQDPAHSRVAILDHAVGPTGDMLIIVKYGPDSEGGFRFAVGTDQRHIDAAIREFDGVLLVALGSLGLILLASVTGLVVFGLAPFSKLANALRHVRSGATQSVEGDHPSEVQPLVNELNSLIKGQRDSLQRARAQAGNLAHALKTPLAIVNDEAAQLEKSGAQESAIAIADQCQAMQMHIDHHIARARAQAVSRIPGTRAAAGEIIAGIIRALSRLHIRRNIEVEQYLDGSLQVAMDGQDFAELVANLVDNAFKFARSRIILTVEAGEPGFVRITVADDGPGLPPLAREIVFSPGIRLDETRPGTGLGLSIVRDLLELYGGQIELGTSKLGGLAANMTLHRHA